MARRRGLSVDARGEPRRRARTRGCRGAGSRLVAQKVPLLDLGSLLGEDPGHRQGDFGEDGHPVASGHGKIAAGVLAHMEKLKMLSRRPYRCIYGVTSTAERMNC